MKAVTIAANDLRRMVRWRANIFFLFVLPMLLILLLGAAFGGSQKARIGVLNQDRGALARQFTDALASRPSTQLVRYQSYSALQKAVARGDVDAGLVIPANYDTLLERGGTASLGYFARPDSVAQQLRPTVQSVAADQSRTLAAAQALQKQLKLPFDSARARANAIAARTPGVQLFTTAPDGGPYTVTAGRFQEGASTMLVLFIFFTSVVTGAGFMIETRRLGIARRILSTPTSTRTLVAGTLLGGLTVALVQALIIVLGSMLLFGVAWGNALGTAAVVLSFCLVGTGVAVLVGSVFASEDQARPVGSSSGSGSPPSAARWPHSKSSPQPPARSRTSPRTPGQTTPSPSY